ncbi:hypothetical protein BOTBODRAFT_125649 [Botryobasidium botryosum FD-172 SS1]|uniref:Glutamine synthetase n=1 Tax=Botryobasidium botryosum (strain FD-172 SS1) TaxID=930990 RepID=A0A067N7I0_BOTB1|nr:hypothetical protein BOTBODRAFT_125649 [Botryobasidium botryosum FD-172 SS1]
MATGSDLSLATLKESGVRFVRLTWVDFGNCVRYKILPLKHFEKLVASARGGFTVTVAIMGAVFLTVAEGVTVVGEYVWKPDLSTLRLAPYADGHATVLGNFTRETANSAGQRESHEIDLCPRGILRRVVESAKKTAGVDFLVGFETEFVLLKSTSPVQPVNDHGYSCGTATASGTTETQALEEMANAIMDAGIELEMYHSEAAPGQYEIITGPLPPLEAADALICTRETIQNVASKHGLRATFTPLVFDHSCGTAAHTHVSLKSDRPTSSANVEDAPDMTELEASFLQSLLNHLPSVLAFTMPTPASYSRMVDGIWSGGTYVAWGRDNRECPVRLCGFNGDWNFEIKTADGTSNPHLALSAILSAGMLGVKEGIKLQAKNCLQPPATVTEEQRAAWGVTQRLPSTVEQSWESLKADQALVSELGEHFIERYFALTKIWAESMTASTPEETLRLYLENY